MSFRRKNGMEVEMGIDLVFKIAAIGIIVAVLDQVLKRAGREEMATMTSLAGLAIVLIMVVKQIAELFSTIKNVFGL
jgi:stage III sporulation protein AC